MKTWKPWIAYKVLAAGAIHPADGFKYAFQNGADFACVGMLDFKCPRENAVTAKTILKDSDPRPTLADIGDACRAGNWWGVLRDSL